jgi:hypothetical protein
METTSQSVRKEKEISHGARAWAQRAKRIRERKKEKMKEDDEEERKKKKRERGHLGQNLSRRPYRNDRVEGRRMIRNT